MTDPAGNPLRSEAAMFRVLVIAVLAAAPVILAGVLIGSFAALVVLGLELGIGVGVAVSRRRERRAGGAPPR